MRINSVKNALMTERGAWCKLNIGRKFLRMLRAARRDLAQDWLRENSQNLGRPSSLYLQLRLNEI